MPILSGDEKCYSVPGYLVRRCTGNEVIDMASSIPDEQNLYMSDFEKSYALFSFIGHSGHTGPPSEPVSWLMFKSGYLNAHCIGCVGIPDKTICLNWDCDNRETRTFLMDDVLLAILNGCNTARNRGVPSMAEAMINQGVDCVIGTKRKVLHFVFISWYYNVFTELLDNKRPIAEAAYDAYDNTISQMSKFYTDIDDIEANEVRDNIQDIIALLGTSEDNVFGETFNQLETFNNTYVILDNNNNPNSEVVSTQSVVPARYGACQNCP